MGMDELMARIADDNAFARALVDPDRHQEMAAVLREEYGVSFEEFVAAVRTWTARLDGE